jgi:hypothetical protein
MDKVDPNHFLNTAANLAQEIHTRKLILSSVAMAESHQKELLDLAEAEKTAEMLLSRHELNAANCAALSTTTSDLKDVTIASGSVLLPLVYSGVVSLPLTPLAFAAVGVLIFRGGVAAYCSKFN